MQIEFTKSGWEDYCYWIDNDVELAKKIVTLIKGIQSDPFRGIGKPEALRYSLKGFWSRRINQEHRLVYRVSGKRGEDQKCSIIQCRYHYDK